MSIKSKSDIIKIIQQLEHHIADDFEAQDLDFKQWNYQSTDDNISKMIKYAVCMANGGGGSVVFGVADKVQGKENVLLGVPHDLEICELEKTVYAHTEPHIMPLFDEIFYDDYSIRILIMTVFSRTPPYTTVDGAATIRQGKECLPFKYFKGGCFDE